MLKDAIAQGLVAAGQTFARSWLTDESALLLKPDIHFAAAFGVGESTEEHYYIRLVTEVFYARAIDVSILSERKISGEGDVQLNNPSNALSNPAQVPDSEGSSKSNQSASSDSLPVAGGSVKVISRSASSIGLRRVYDRPIAIGIRGITLKVNKNNGWIESATYPGTPTPMLYQFLGINPIE